MVQSTDAVVAEDVVAANVRRRVSSIKYTAEGRPSGVDFEKLVDEARDATEQEHNMGIWQAICTYPKAVGWSMLASTALIMEGYDLVVIGSFYGFPTFTEKYGVPVGDGKYAISSAWQSGLSNGALVGEIIGLMAAGLLADRFGYRFTIGLALVLVICFIFITFFAVNIEMLLVGEILCGLPWGVFQTITTAYAAEVTPTPLRPYLTTYVNLCWVFGQLIGAGVLRALLDVQDQWGYRIPFAIQWVWPVPLLIGIIFAPESPWWLVRKGRFADAEHSLRRLTSKKVAGFDPSKTIAMMIHTDELEKETVSGTRYWDCFKGTDRRRTEIAAFVWMIQTFSGSGLFGYSTQFYEQAGLSTTYSFDFQMGQYAIGAVGTFLSWMLMAKVGRRSLYLWGLTGMFITLLVIGFLGLAPRSNTSASLAVGSMLLVMSFVYDATVGPICYCLVAEIPSTRLRSKTVVLARTAYNVVGIVNNVITPRMVTPKQVSGWDWGAKAGLFWAGMCFLSIVWTYFRLPEPKGKTYGDLDMLFEHRVSARKFKKTSTDQFGQENEKDIQSSIAASEKEDETMGVSLHENVQRQV